MKEIIWKSILAIIIVASILTLGVIASPEIRNVVGLLGITLVIGTIVFNRKKT